MIRALIRNLARGPDIRDFIIPILVVGLCLLAIYSLWRSNKK